MVARLTIREKVKLLQFKTWVETLTIHDYGLHRVENGFAKAWVDSFDNEKIILKLNHGIDEEPFDRVDNEQFTFKRERLLEPNMYELAKEIIQESDIL